MAKKLQADDGERLEQFLGRVVPHSIEAEESLIGAMMISRDAVAEAVEVVQEEDFFTPSHSHIFRALATLHAQGAPNDPVTVAEELRRYGLLDQVGGLQDLVALQASTPAIASAGRYAQIVEEYSLLRKLIRAATEIAEMAYSLPQDVAEAVDLAEAKIFEVAEHRTSDSMLPLREVLMQTLDDLEALYGRTDAVTGVPTGFVDLDELLSGLHPSNLVIVGARPGMGKTSFALGLGVNVAKATTEPVLMFSLEMSHQELTQRLVAAEARVDSTRLRSGRLQEKDWEKIHMAIGRLAEARIYIDDDPNLTVMDIRARARRLKAREGLGLVIVDYLQLMSGRRNVESRQVEVSEISRGLKILARELNVPVIALSQLSRNLEARQDKRPQLADLRESGCVAWDTDIALGDGRSLPISKAWMEGLSNFDVLSYDANSGTLQSSKANKVFLSGIKPVFALSSSSGKTITATGSHPFLTKYGWLALSELRVGDQVGVVGAGVPDRALAGRMADRSDSQFLRESAQSEEDRAEVLMQGFHFEQIIQIDALGDAPVFDVTVEGTHSFVGDGFVIHNSLEQDADVVVFIYRDEMYSPDTPDKGTAEIIVAKHRSGPTGTVYLAFLNNYTLFANMAPMQ